jgi:hypothetical protein
MKQSIFLKRISLFIIFIFVSVFVIAQDDPGGPGGPGDPGGTPQGWVPIDGGLAALLAAGVGYGAKKAYEYRSKKQKIAKNKME